MSKKFIYLRRRELIWETRENYYCEEEFNEWKKNCIYWYQRRMADQHNVWNYDNIIKELESFTWDEAVAYIENRYNQSELVEHTTTYGKFSDKKYNYYFDAYDEFEQDVRESNYEADVSGTNYADDFDEEWSVENEEDVSGTNYADDFDEEWSVENEEDD